MKILLVVHQFFPEFTAGTEVLTLGVARELRKRGDDVRVFTAHPGRDDLSEDDRCDRYLHEGFEVYRFHHAYVPMAGQTSMIEVGSDNHLAARYFATVLADFEPQRVHYFHLNRLGTGLIVEGEKAGVRQSMTPTDFWTICPTAQLRYPDGRLCDGPSRHAGNCVKHFAQNPARAEVIRAMARLVPTPAADALVRLTLAAAPSGVPAIDDIQALGRRLGKTVGRLNRLESIVVPNVFMRDKLVEHGVEPHRIVNAPFGVQLPERPMPARVPGGAAGPLRLGFIGTLAPHKGAHVLVEAFRELPPGTASLRIYGKTSEFPDYVDALRERAAGIAGIEFAGTFASDAISDVMADLDVLIVPSLWYENTPLVIYSAHAARTVVVASDFPGLSEAVRDGVDGLLFPPGDASALARQLVRLTSPECRSHLRAAITPPKSIAAYVSDLLQIWQAA